MSKYFQNFSWNYLIIGSIFNNSKIMSLINLLFWKSFVAPFRPSPKVYFASPATVHLPAPANGCSRAEPPCRAVSSPISPLFFRLFEGFLSSRSPLPFPSRIGAFRWVFYSNRTRFWVYLRNRVFDFPDRFLAGGVRSLQSKADSL